jgi:hypothetical protein
MTQEEFNETIAPIMIQLKELMTANELGSFFVIARPDGKFHTAHSAPEHLPDRFLDVLEEQTNQFIHSYRRESIDTA